MTKLTIERGSVTATLVGDEPSILEIVSKILDAPKPRRKYKPRSIATAKKKAKRHHFYHGGFKGTRKYLTKNKARIEKDILNPNLTLKIVVRRHLIGSATLYNYFGKTIEKRYRLYPFLRRGRSKKAKVRT